MTRVRVTEVVEADVDRVLLRGVRLADGQVVTFHVNGMNAETRRLVSLVKAGRQEVHVDLPEATP